MSKTDYFPPDLYQYMLSCNRPLDPLMADLVGETQAMGGISRMQIAIEQAAFLGFMIKILGARQVVEVGTFTGLSSLAMARALPPEGHLHCFDISEQYTSTARRYWEKDGVSDRITLHIGPALEKLSVLSGRTAVDLAFLDADKTGYIDYYETILEFLAPHGIIIADNLFMNGKVVDSQPDADASAIISFAAHLKNDPRTETILVPIGDGFSITRWAV